MSRIHPAAPWGRRFPGLAGVAGLAAAAVLLASGCGAGRASGGTKLEVVATESVLADLARNVGGNRVVVDSLVPLGADLHAFQPSPRDVKRVADADVLVVNGAGLEARWLETVLKNAGGRARVVTASEGLTPRTSEEAKGDKHAGEAHGHDEDPHFWFDPLSVVKYIENIRDGLAAADPEGKAAFERASAAYIERLKELDGWIRTEVAQLPKERRVLVTDHESFGYFADRYEFEIIGAVIPSVSAAATPSGKELAELVDRIREHGAPAIFTKAGSTPGLVEQVARETGAKVVGGLHTHSLTEPGGAAPDYLALMRHNVRTIVNALK